MTAPRTYSAAQILLHWSIVALVLFQVFVHGEITEAWSARLDGTSATDPAPNAHTIIGTVILILMTVRLFLRARRGVPEPVDSEGPLIGRAAKTLHISFYVVLIAMPIFGIAAWFFDIRFAAQLHEWCYWALLILIPLHLIAALVQHFFLKTESLKRIVGRSS